jgi:hypothetical protein
VESVVLFRSRNAAVSLIGRFYPLVTHVAMVWVMVVSHPSCRARVWFRTATYRFGAWMTPCLSRCCAALVAPIRTWLCAIPNPEPCANRSVRVEHASGPQT